jgi:hypothetical protein
MNDELKRCREVIARYNALEDARTAQILELQARVRTAELFWFLSTLISSGLALWIALH